MVVNISNRQAHLKNRKKAIVVVAERVRKREVRDEGGEFCKGQIIKDFATCCRRCMTGSR